MGRTAGGNRDVTAAAIFEVELLAKLMDGRDGVDGANGGWRFAGEGGGLAVGAEG